MAWRSILHGCAALACGGGLALSHSLLFKPLYNGKTNASTRGAAGSAAAQLWMMLPSLHLTGVPETMGFRATLQDEEARTSEDCDLSVVRYAANGITPDETATGEVSRVRFRVFGFGLSGQQAYDFLLTVAFAQPVPANFGIGVGLLAAPAWPSDGLSVHGQLNLANDPMRPRVPAPYDQQTWAFERPAGSASAMPLGGRVIDTLAATGVYTTSVLQGFVRTSAYGNGTEDLVGPESMHPDASRGDQFGFLVQGNNDANFAGIMLVASLALTATPLPFPPDPKSSVYLDLTYPVVLDWRFLDQHGQGTIGPLAIAAFPPLLRAFWVQGLIFNPASGVLRVTDVVGVRGL